MSEITILLLILLPFAVIHGIKDIRDLWRDE